ncbi:hypothetical protein FSP39_020116 [Pinctada imbricata]|uniref:Neurotransmitter-gated ion-channel ligand-binding domain-containing protein n=1 Tax=Pinctada imbricata TaxID=66713 RepID=A0AA88XJQ5_PINIB|nr:hypothetical protein FSP39_020116 [Pinctada imbricata]
MRILEILFVIWNVDVISAGSLTDVNNIYSTVLTNYTVDTRPITNQNAVLYITTKFHLSSVIKLDEPSGEFAAAGILDLDWTDESLKWDRNNYDGQNEIKISSKKVWTPSLVILNPSASSKHLTVDNTKVNVFSDGTVNWLVADVFHTACDIDITYFPFDIQTCKISLISWNYDVLVQFVPQNLTMNTQYYTENGVWELERTEILSGTNITPSAAYVVDFSVVLRRRSTLLSSIFWCQ